MPPCGVPERELWQRIQIKLLLKGIFFWQSGHRTREEELRLKKGIAPISAMRADFTSLAFSKIDIAKDFAKREVLLALAHPKKAVKENHPLPLVYSFLCSIPFLLWKVVRKRIFVLFLGHPRFGACNIRQQQPPHMKTLTMRMDAILKQLLCTLQQKTIRIL